MLLAAFLGLGTGGVFAWVVGAAGGLGGYFPPLVMGATYDAATHSYTIGLGLLCLVALIALVYTLVGVRAPRDRTPAGS